MELDEGRYRRDQITHAARDWRLGKGSGLCVYIELLEADHEVEGRGRKFKVWPSVVTLAKQLQVHESSVDRAIRQLASLGYIQIKKRRRRGDVLKHNLYVIARVFPEIPAHVVKAKDKNAARARHRAERKASQTIPPNIPPPDESGQPEGIANEGRKASQTNPEGIANGAVTREGTRELEHGNLNMKSARKAGALVGNNFGTRLEALEHQDMTKPIDVASLVTLLPGLSRTVADGFLRSCEQFGNPFLVGQAFGVRHKLGSAHMIDSIERASQTEYQSLLGNAEWHTMDFDQVTGKAFGGGYEPGPNAINPVSGDIIITTTTERGAH